MICHYSIAVVVVQLVAVMNLLFSLLLFLIGVILCACLVLFSLVIVGVGFWFLFKLICLALASFLLIGDSDIHGC